MKGTLSHTTSQILNLIGLAEKIDGNPMARDNTRNRLFNCLLDSDGFPEFTNNIIRLRDLYQLYLDIENDISNNVNNLKKLKPKLKFRSNNIYIYKIKITAGYEIIGQLLKEHLRYLGYNSTYIIYQEVPQKGGYQIFVYTSNPLINCFTIAVDHCGGGHTNRAGMSSSKKTIKKTIDNIVETIKKMIIAGEKQYAGKR